MESCAKITSQCIVISYVYRASTSKSTDNDDSCSNFCLTAARAVTCESSEPSVTPSRVSTRSSRILSQDQGDTSNLITPVNKIRGLVKTLAPRKRQTTKTTDSPGTSELTEEEPQKSPQQKMSLITSLKRKRTSSSTSPKRVKNQEGPLVDPKSMSRNVIPVLTLTRASGKANNYVAFLSEKNGNLDKETDVKSNKQSATPDNNSHKHNTRYRVKNCDDIEESEKKSDVQSHECLSLPNGESLVEVYTEQTSTATSSSVLEVNGKRKHSNVNMAYAKRGVHPKNHNQDMRVGDIIWGKVHGHPWWPGRILGILCHPTETDAGFVKVAWYGSTTTSEISCSFLVTFQENFKQLFKKQKHGAYRRAVREAQQDLQIMSVDGQVLPG